jgi:glucose/arabinose dehydrogenase
VSQLVWQLVLTICISIGGSLLMWSLASSNLPSLAAQGNWPQIVLVERVSGLSQPVHIAHAADGSDRLFIVERGGRIRIVKNGTLLSTPFLDITDRVRSSASEQGLLSVAFPPDFPDTGVFYVNYTSEERPGIGKGDTVVARFRVDPDIPDVADPNSEQIVLTIAQPYTNHNGGQLAFGPDGYLYIGMGDGGSGGDPDEHAQNPNSLLGKMLRVDVATSTYTIPPTNPFVGDPGVRDEIWALGLRNPWRFSFDRETGDLYIADVGQHSREEINFQPASSTGGENYGWDIFEGTQCFEPPSGCTPPSNYSPPVAEYETHGDGNCAVTGGVVYRGLNYCTMQRVYFYGDYCSGRVWGLRHGGSQWQTTLLDDTPFNISTFGEDEVGNVYVADYSGGKIYQITTANPVIYPDFADPPGIGMEDVQAAALHWYQQINELRWDARFDINQDGEVTVVDIMLTAAELGQACQ